MKPTWITAALLAVPLHSAISAEKSGPAGFPNIVFAKTPDLARLASGAEFVSKDDPPLLAIHGAADKQVLIDQSERIVDAYRNKGLEAELMVVPGGVHAGEGYHQGDIRETVVAFLSKRPGVERKRTEPIQRAAVAK